MDKLQAMKDSIVKENGVWKRKKVIHPEDVAWLIEQLEGLKQENDQVKGAYTDREEDILYLNQTIEEAVNIFKEIKSFYESDLYKRIDFFIKGQQIAD